MTSASYFHFVRSVTIMLSECDKFLMYLRLALLLSSLVGASWDLKNFVGSVMGIGGLE